MAKISIEEIVEFQFNINIVPVLALQREVWREFWSDKNCPGLETSDHDDI